MSDIDLDFARYEVVTVGEQFCWLCRRCATVHMDANTDDAGEVTQKGVTLADLIESATEHELDRHHRVRVT